MDVFSDRKSKQLLTSHQYTTWGLIKLYWQSEYKHIAYFFSVTIIILTILSVALDVIFNYWSNYFYNALQAYDARLVVKLLLFFIILAAINMVVVVYRYYVEVRLLLYATVEVEARCYLKSSFARYGEVQKVVIKESYLTARR